MHVVSARSCKTESCAAGLNLNAVASALVSGDQHVRCRLSCGFVLKWGLGPYVIPSSPAAKMLADIALLSMFHSDCLARLRKSFVQIWLVQAIAVLIHVHVNSELRHSAKSFIQPHMLHSIADGPLTKVPPPFKFSRGYGEFPHERTHGGLGSGVVQPCLSRAVPMGMIRASPFSGAQSFAFRRQEDELPEGPSGSAGTMVIHESLVILFGPHVTPSFSALLLTARSCKLWNILPVKDAVWRKTSNTSSVNYFEPRASVVVVMVLSCLSEPFVSPCLACKPPNRRVSKSGNWTRVHAEVPSDVRSADSEAQFLLSAQVFCRRCLCHSRRGRCISNLIGLVSTQCIVLGRRQAQWPTGLTHHVDAGNGHNNSRRQVALSAMPSGRE